MDVLGVQIPDEQARTAALVGLGMAAALLVLLAGRKARRLVIGLAITAAIGVGLVAAMRAGLVPDPRSVIPGLSS